MTYLATNNQSMLPTRLSFVLRFSILYAFEKTWFIFGIMNFYKLRSWTWLFLLQNWTWFLLKTPRSPSSRGFFTPNLFKHKSICSFIQILKVYFLTQFLSPFINFFKKGTFSLFLALIFSPLSRPFGIAWRSRGFHIPSSKGFRPQCSDGTWFSPV